MNLHDLRHSLDFDDLGRQMHAFMSSLYPICRSITGSGLRQTLKEIRSQIPIETHEVASGTPILDWTVPKEWNIREAYLIGPDGERVVDYRWHNLHVWSYSTPIHRKMSLAELRPHLASNPAQPEWIPYRTSYYQENWGFAMSHRQLQSLPDGEYEVVIDTTLEPGALSYGEMLLPGSTERRILLSAHCCHPSLCNDNLSGIATATFLAKLLSRVELRHQLQFVFAPGTIGAIAWLARNDGRLEDITHGFVIAGGGDEGNFHYKQTRSGDAEVDQIVEHVLAGTGQPHEIVPFIPYGYDERQYCSPGFNLPVGALSRTPYGRYPQYHTSADNLDFVSPQRLGQTLALYLEIISALEHNQRFRSLNPKGEPQLGRRGLYRQTGGHIDQPQREAAMLWLLNFSDGQHSILDIARRSKVPFDALIQASRDLQAHGLLAAA